MVRIIKSTELEDTYLNKDEKLWVYNGLDCCLTAEIFDKQKPIVAERTQRTYEFELGMLAPAMLMMRRGFRVDEDKVNELLTPLQKRREYLKKLLNVLAYTIWDKELNHGSPVQLQNFFYKELAIGKIMKNEKGKLKISTDREALEKLEMYPRARPFVHVISKLRDIDKQINVLTAARSEDGRYRCSYNVAGTETGRWSSSANAFGEGSNLQNVTHDLREIFIPDDGMMMFYSDLDQAESWVVGALSGDKNYLDALYGGDLHTSVVKMIWPDMPWTGNIQEDRILAEQPYYLHFSYRDLAKRAGHGLNYGLQPASLGRHLKIQLKYATRFALLYLGGTINKSSLERWHTQDPKGGFDKLIETAQVLGKTENGDLLLHVKGAFEDIRQWHYSVEEAIQTKGYITTAFGRQRQFWGRATDATVLRKAIAFEPQSTVGDLLNVGLFRCWNELEGTGPELLGQVHDAIVGQVPIDEVDEHMPRVLDCMTNPLEINGHKIVVPSSVEIGMDWHHVKGWKPKETSA